jgi:hypothetical protein
MKMKSLLSYAILTASIIVGFAQYAKADHPECRNVCNKGPEPCILLDLGGPQPELCYGTIIVN